MGPGRATRRGGSASCGWRAERGQEEGAGAHLTNFILTGGLSSGVRWRRASCSSSSSSRLSLSAVTLSAHIAWAAATADPLDLRCDSPARACPTLLNSRLSSPRSRSPRQVGAARSNQLFSSTARLSALAEGTRAHAVQCRNGTDSPRKLLARPPPPRSSRSSRSPERAASFSASPPPPRSSSRSAPPPMPPPPARP